jgi:hypothetical protein
MRGSFFYAMKKGQNLTRKHCPYPGLSDPISFPADKHQSDRRTILMPVIVLRF